MKTLYLKDSGNRKRQYALTTRIFVENNKKLVIKEPCFPEGLPHVQRIAESQVLFAQYYTNIEISKTWLENGALYAEYIDGIPLSDMYQKAIQKKDRNELIKLLEYNIEIMLGQNNTCAFSETDEFVKIFGKAPVFEGEPALIFSFFESAPENIFLRNRDINKPCLIDYEWSFNFPMPVSLLKFRLAQQVSMLPGIDEVISMDERLNIFNCDLSFEQGMLFINKFFHFIYVEKRIDYSQQNNNYEKNIRHERLDYLVRERDQLLTERESLSSSMLWHLIKPLRSVLGPFVRKNRLLWLPVKLLLSIQKYGIKETLKKGKSFVRRSFSKPMPVQKIAKYSIPNIYTKSIIFVGHDAKQFGAEVLALNIIKQLKERFKYEVYLILKDGGKLIKHFDAVSTETVCLATDGFNKTKLKTWIRSTKTNKAICNTVVTGDILHILTECGVTCISLVHEMEKSIRQNSWENYLSIIAKDSIKIIYPSEYVRESNEKIQKIPKEKLIIQPQGLYVVNHYLHDRESIRSVVRKKHNIPNNGKIVLGMGYGDYRKGIDLFVRCMLKVSNSFEFVCFVWVGDIDSAMTSKINSFLGYRENRNRLVITGWENDPTKYYAAADIFLLTSREDPFPSVVLEAMNSYLPVIAFEGGGGYVDIVNEETGFLVPMEDTDAMSECIMKLLLDDACRIKKGDAANKYIKKYNFIDYIYSILFLLGEEYKKVSVVIPNYNYAHFLPERLDSILNQTYPVSELIILDDNSNDKSQEVINAYQKKYSLLIKTYFNDVNSGSVFKQWQKGIELATNSLIWIAEADDVSDSKFLESLMSYFEDDNIVMAYSQSKIIGQNSEVLGDYLEYVKDISDRKWKRDYINLGVNEIENALCIKNTIPNVSAVVFRKECIPDIYDKLSNYKYAGDWFFYINILKKGKIAFCAKELNYHRRGGSGIISGAEKTLDFINEIFDIHEYVIKHFDIEEDVVQYSLKHFTNEVLRLTNKEIKEFPDLLKKRDELKDCFYRKKKQNTSIIKRILVVVPDIEIGGGQMVAVHLANYWSKSFQVYLYNTRPALFDKMMYDNISTEVCILPSHGNPEELSEYIDFLKIDFISSHVWWSDKITYLAIKSMGEKPKWIISMHGCYENIMLNSEIDNEFNIIAPKMLQMATVVVYIADKNLQYVQYSQLNNINLTKMLNGYTIPEHIDILDRSDCNINENDFVFGLIARGIKEKGWLEAITAIIQYNVSIKNTRNKAVHLLLIGDSEYVQQLKKDYRKYSYLHFLGSRNNVPSWIALCDAALLPTYFISESHPMVLIQFLAQGKPCIATDIGEIKTMLTTETGDLAGILLPYSNKGIITDNIVEGIKIMLEDDDWYKKALCNAKSAFKKFDMNIIGKKYLDLADGRI